VVVSQNEEVEKVNWQRERQAGLRRKKLSIGTGERRKKWSTTSNERIKINNRESSPSVFTGNS